MIWQISNKRGILVFITELIKRYMITKENYLVNYYGKQGHCNKYSKIEKLLSEKYLANKNFLSIGNDAFTIKNIYICT